MSRIERYFLAIAYGRHPISGYAEGVKVFLGSTGSSLTQGQVILIGASFISVPFYPDGVFRVVF